PLDTWKEYLKWNVINSLSPYLSDEYVNQHFEFYGKTFSGSKKLLPRWKRVLGLINGEMGEALGQLYVKQYFPPEAKQKMIVLVGNLKAAFHDRIQKLDWMSDSTKQKAIEKLAAMNVKVGYPDKWRDFSKLEITRDNYIQNILNANKFDMEYTLSKIGKAPDRTEWGMTPQTVNAYYSPNMNEIVFPAGILQPPFFSKDADDAVNYGGIGGVIGHEMTHGFDDQGRQYDKNGNLSNWWTKEDAEKFTAKTQALIEHYNNYVELDTFHINGALTLGENIADLGGITISYDALQRAWKQNPPKDKIDGFTPTQRYLLSWAQVWRQNIRDEELKKRLKDDVHSPGDARVNVVLSNLDIFYDAFNVKPENKLYRAPENRVKIW
ncbi:MAG TPA: M13 family metallopeptidase, partial [Candidatus Kapabacteria bacterium]|nr:M13 family metallopeptidase [Candidatus Kapabacteria bacterium]